MDEFSVVVNTCWSNLISPALSGPGSKDTRVTTKESLAAAPFIYKERNKRKWSIGWDLVSKTYIVKLNGLLHSELRKAPVKIPVISRHKKENTPIGQVMYVQHAIIILPFRL